MQYARKLRKGDKVAIVSLSSGMLGEEFCSHNIEIGVKRLKEYGLEPVFMSNALKGIEYLKEHPEARAKDLKDAFLDDAIAGIICAIGGDDTYRILPYLMKDEDFIKAVQKNPKLFTGFSDTTINHLMFHKLGLSTYYGPNFICDLAEISDEMLPYSKKAFESYIEGNEYCEITSSEIWYQERTDFSKEAVGTERISHREEHGFELLQGKECFEGRLLGGCLESLYDILTTTRYEDEKAVCEKYGLFPDIEEWKEKILFIETCEEKPVPEQFEKEIDILKEKGVFDVVSGVLVGKPQDEAYYDEYKNILVKVVNNPDLPIVYNVNFGHATPRCNLFSEIYCVPEQIKKSYYKIKVMEILLFLFALDTTKEKIENRYFNKNLVAKVKEIHQYMLNHIDEKLTIACLADKHQISATNLKKYFKEIYGLSIYAYLKEKRIQKAAELLRETNHEIGKIAGMVGYDNASKFSNSFKSIMGINPSEYKKSV